MTESDVAPILLIRAIEEQDAQAFSASVLTDAVQAAGDPADEPAWFARRSAFLLSHLPAPQRAIVHMPTWLDRWNLLTFGIAVAVGLASNYLGPPAKIHALFNPILILVAWNLLVYLAVGLRALYRWQRRTHPVTSVGRESKASEPESSSSSASASSPLRANPQPLPWWMTLVQLFVPTVWTHWQRWTAWRDRASDVKGNISGVGTTAVRFWLRWLALARPLFAARIRRLLHWSAIGIAVGAIVGMYIRGLFFDYNVVWRSTFIRDQADITLLLQVVLAPSLLLSGWSFTGDLSVSQLLRPEGAPAALWIHLYALTALVCIVIPRIVFIVGETVSIYRLSRRFPVDFDEVYFRALIEPARALQVQRFVAQIETAVQIECTKFSAAVATFVCERLYDGRVVPALRDFQQHGGKITTLEARIHQACTAFEPELQSYTATAQGNFVRALSLHIERIAGRSVLVPMDLGDRIVATTQPPQEAVIHPSNAFIYGVTDTISLAVSGAVALTLGTISGGFGHTLGVAIITSLLGTTGPIGFLIGALGGLAAVAVGWQLTRDTMTDAVKNIDLPGWVISSVLWQSRLQGLIADGRVQCYLAVMTQIEKELAMRTADIARAIGERVKPQVQRAL